MKNHFKQFDLNQILTRFDITFEDHQNLIFFLKQKNTQLIYAIKQFSFLSQLQLLNHIQQNKQKMKHQSQLFNRVLDIFIHKEQSPLQRIYKSFILYELPGHPLKNQVQQRMKNKNYFPQHYVWKLIYTLVTGLQIQQKLNKPYQVINSSSILIDRNRNFILCDKQFMGKTNYKAKLNNFNIRNIYLAPQLLSDICLRKQQSTSNRFLADTFALAMTVLQMCHLKFMNELYWDYSIKKQSIQRKIQELPSIYKGKVSHFLKYVLLKENPRTNFYKLKKFLELELKQEINAKKQKINQQFLNPAEKQIINKSVHSHTSKKSCNNSSKKVIIKQQVFVQNKQSPDKDQMSQSNHSKKVERSFRQSLRFKLEQNDEEKNLMKNKKSQNQLKPQSSILFQSIISVQQIQPQIIKQNNNKQQQLFAQYNNSQKQYEIHPQDYSSNSNPQFTQNQLSKHNQFSRFDYILQQQPFSNKLQPYFLKSNKIMQMQPYSYQNLHKLQFSKELSVCIPPHLKTQKYKNSQYIYKTQLHDMEQYNKQQPYTIINNSNEQEKEQLEIEFKNLKGQNKNFLSFKGKTKYKIIVQNFNNSETIKVKFNSNQASQNKFSKHLRIQSSKPQLSIQHKFKTKQNYNQYYNNQRKHKENQKRSLGNQPYIRSQRQFVNNQQKIIGNYIQQRKIYQNDLTSYSKGNIQFKKGIPKEQFKLKTQVDPIINLNICRKNKNQVIRKIQPNRLMQKSREYPTQQYNNNSSYFNKFIATQTESIYFGKLQNQQGQYQGQIWKGKKHGKGTVYFLNGFFYEGTWKQNQKSGFGKLFNQKNFLVYQGDWQKDMIHGFGKLYNEQAQKLQGRYDYLDLTDICRYWIQFQGYLKYNKKNGYGKIYLSNGEWLEGQFFDDELKGQSVFHGLDKDIKGIWDENLLVTQL